MKTYKRFVLVILACIFLILSFFVIGQIYAKYMSSTNGSASIPISRWNILVNAQSIKDNVDFSSKITPIFPGNEYIANGIIAPTAEGYFDLTLDYTATDVSFKYDILALVAEESAITDLIVVAYDIDDGERIEITDSTIPLTDTLSYSDEVKTRKIRIYVMWNDDLESSTMDNFADTNSTLGTSTDAILNVNVKLTQVTSNTAVNEIP